MVRPDHGFGGGAHGRNGTRLRYPLPSLRACYAMSGTEMAYGAICGRYHTHSTISLLVLAGTNSGSAGTLSCYAGTNSCSAGTKSGYAGTNAGFAGTR
eukprot:1777301-Rhodomonas_salina.2